MPEIRASSSLVTQITTVEVDAGKQNELLSLMIERARFMATQPGFVSISLHRSLDGTRIVNYIQWASRELLEAAHHSPEFREKWPRFGSLAEDVAPNLYEIVHVEDTASKVGG